ncbi:hypothetical protein AVEN_178153-1 [Araneus ventricosus]|uniref:Histone-lysine N-methyltransferase SETMAR n=1 Tax=Araneus ventricosus TaxID=182803 RepID=A0A4Y2GAQ1_ARAVE|nr:hypothetical protein AVEN_178153-1 [Araneus ventricosus]
MTQQLIGSSTWEQMNYPPYSPGLAPSDFHLFLHVNKFLSGRRFDDVEKAQDAVTSWLTSQASTFYDDGKENLVSRYDKCAG